MFLSKFNFSDYLIKLAVPAFYVLVNDGCTSQGTYVETSFRAYDKPTSGVQELDHNVTGKSTQSREEMENNAKIIAESLGSEKPDGYWTQDFEFSADNKSYSMKLHRESGWLPEKYIMMLNEARDGGRIINYELYTAGLINDANKNGTRDPDEQIVQVPMAVVRKTDGTFAFVAYERNDSSKLAFELEIVNAAKYNDAATLANAVCLTPGAVRTDWPELSAKTGKIRKNCPVDIRTNAGTKKIIAPYVADGVVHLDSELKAYLEACKALPRHFAVLK